MKRKNYTLIMLLISLFLIFTACEEIVVIDLNSSDPKIVIEGTITDQPGPCLVKIAQTTDYYNPDSIPTISGAQVQISDNAGQVEILTEISPGIYKTKVLKGVPGRTYTLTVSHENEIYQAVSTMSEAIEIDSLYYTYNDMGIRGSQYELVCVFQDKPGIEDYCRIKVYKNNEPESSYFLYNGRLSDGNLIKFKGFRIEELEASDTIRVDLLTIDKSVYEYYSTLSDVIASDPRGMISTEVPANPNSNLSGGALGYFGAYTVRTDSIVIK